eukprot:CAMPEP_0175074336 /NCGR_PEP_ID=MMETSP0052_2-20121109/21239_1 /TAXON_ID=51329 ORGANISM="Polytomella parva, Strain SAG 63-3" /NCGR_SAMPLE_ID=MMETSP0052_2 /ASSEMBLY_ACC=CAM_ASM_000194 /LENGTH=104 /DNA_ID=CAMNT_0016342601 /DNA_START=96 /DNA_END=410 /DNA_ORIENTATION=+
MKGLLYGGDDRPITPIKEGKRRAPQASLNPTQPYATYDVVAGDLVAKEHHARPQKKDLCDKVNSEKGFDPDVYRAQLLLNQENLAESKIRNYKGCGNILNAQQI